MSPLLGFRHHWVCVVMILQSLTQKLCPQRGEVVLTNQWTSLGRVGKASSTGSTWREKGCKWGSGSGCSLSPWSTVPLTSQRLDQIYEFSTLHQNGACSDLQKVTQPYWVCVNIPWPKIKWVKIQDRFRNVPIYSWKLRVSVWMQRAQRLHFPSLNTDALAQGHEVAYSEPASCHSNQQLMLQEALLEAHCSSHVGTQGSSDTHRTGEGSMVKG